MRTQAACRRPSEAGRPTSSSSGGCGRCRAQSRRWPNACCPGTHIRFADPIPREAFPKLLSEYDVLLFPSIYEEPFARVVQEAMAAGLVVIGTATGGTPEILEDGVNGLVFPPGDADALAAAVVRLLETPGLAVDLAAAGRRTVFERFDQEKMVDTVRRILRRS